MTPLEGIAHQIAREARAAASCVIPGWAYSVAISVELFDGEIKQGFHVRSYPVRAVADELVTIDTDFLDGVTDPDALNLLLRNELEPFIIGIGKIRISETEKGLVVFADDERDGVRLVHDTRAMGDDLSLVPPAQEPSRQPF
jgi:hypothetical protein